MKPTLNFVSLLSLSLLTCACKKDAKLTGAGKGGKATLQIVPVHHNVFKNIVNCKVYIKYNSLELPTKYDDSMSLAIINGQPTAVFNTLKAGSYYIYGYGFDTSIRQNVKGGMPYIVSSETTLDLTLPVTESHL